MRRVYHFDGRDYHYPEDKKIIEEHFKNLKSDIYVPAHFVDPDFSYRMKSGKDDIVKKLKSLDYPDQMANSYADMILHDALPDMYLNIDEWVSNKPLTDVRFGKDGITFNMLFYEWSKNGGVSPDLTYFVPRMKIYIETGKNTGLFPMFL